MGNSAEEQQWMKGLGNNPQEILKGKETSGMHREGERPPLKQSSFLEEVRKGGKRVFPEFLRRKMPHGTSPMLLGDGDLKL